jgi:hypothetical protein
MIKNRYGIVSSSFSVVAAALISMGVIVSGGPLLAQGIFNPCHHECAGPCTSCDPIFDGCDCSCSTQDQLCACSCSGGTYCDCYPD